MFCPEVRGDMGPRVLAVCQDCMHEKRMLDDVFAQLLHVAVSTCVAAEHKKTVSSFHHDLASMTENPQPQLNESGRSIVA